jgi:glycosyltransferase involved in cell wall biosynthesis
MVTRGPARTGTVQVVQRMSPGGIETLALDLIKAKVADRGLFSLQGTTSELVAAWPALSHVGPLLEAFGQGPGFDTGMVRRLAGRLRDIRPASVIVHHIGPLIYGGLAARLAGVPCIVHVEHDAWHYQQNPSNVRYSKMMEFIARPQRVAVTDAIAAQVRAFIPNAKFSVIPPAIDTQRFVPGDAAHARSAIGLDPGWRIVGTAGRLADVKGQHILIAALRDLPGDVHVVIAGDGPLAGQLRQQATDLGLQHRVHLIGRIENLEDVLPAFDVFALPSLNEGLPRVLLEAQACGLPVVASDVGSVSEAVNRSTGLLFTAGDASACARAVSNVLSQPADAQANRLFVEKRYGWQHALTAYRRLVGQTI